MVMGYLRKKMMNHMGAYVMVDVIDQSVVAIKCGKPSP